MTAAQIIYDIGYELALGIHTRGHCSREGCSGTARGSRKCIECLRGDLAGIVGQQIADAYIATAITHREAMREVFRAEEEALERSKG